ncbi:MAG: ferrous iron transport protein B [Bacteroidales bacterium]|jgi:ferrous iron transport protein B|nr:ferrous iron transport protein B [Bacteroidales bacterium]
MANSNEQNRAKRLTDLPTGGYAVISRVGGQGAFRTRISEMGFVKGRRVRVVKNAPLHDPIEYEIMGYKVSLRRREADLIEVMPPDAPGDALFGRFGGVIDEQTLKTSQKEKDHTIRIALVGNPNCGKTTLYNFASGSREHTGNYAGVTIDAKEARFRQNGYTFVVADLPGTYSITEYSPEELYVRNYIFLNRPDVVVNVVDASNLERNLYLTTQLIDMNIKVVIALNMYDELERMNARFDYEHLGSMLGIPIIPTVAAKGRGLHELFARIIEVYEDRDPVVRHIHINYGPEIEPAIRAIQKEIRRDDERDRRYSTRFLAIKLLEKDSNMRHLLQTSPHAENIRQTADREIRRLEQTGEDSEMQIADAKYAFIAGALKETFHLSAQPTTDRSLDIDRVMTHKIWGYPIFILFMWLTFQVTFTVGSYPVQWLEGLVGWTGTQVGTMLPDGPLRELLVDGIIGGVGSVIVFLPNILLLFFFISLMEDSGYMARAVFIMDRLMHKMGLHGKSFIPLIMGFGCNVPAIMATRTLDNKNDRRLTMLIIPLMSCNARLPVYILLISAFFSAYQSLVLFSIYFTGIVLAVALGLLFRKTLFGKKEAPFVMELPPYRFPTPRNILLHAWQKGRQYLRKMGTVILLASILIWALGYFPQKVNFSRNYPALIAQTETDTLLTDAMRTQQLDRLTDAMQEERMEQSYIGRMGKFIEPAIRPLGWDWKIGVSILTGMAAKEIVVTSMGVLYQAGANADEHSASLKEKLREQKFTSGTHIGQPVFSPLKAYCLMIFVLVYFPCVAAIAALRKESNRKWALFTVAYTTGLAWLLAFAIYQTGLLLGGG